MDWVPSNEKRTPKSVCLDTPSRQKTVETVKKKKPRTAVIFAIVNNRSIVSGVTRVNARYDKCKGIFFFRHRFPGGNLKNN